jgi:streptogramin lyase
MRLRALALATLGVLWGCSGGGGSQSAPAVAPSAPAGSVPAATSARFTITVPAASTTSSAARSPKYVSVGTQSIVITLTSVNGTQYTGNPASIATNLSALTPGCSGSPLTCTVTGPAAVGNDVFSVVTYDAAQTLPFTTPAGNVLSEASLSVAVVAGPNTVTTPLVLNGVAKTISATFASNPHISGSMSAGYSIVGNAPYTMTLVAQDATGATIVGNGAPTFTVTSGTSAVAVSSSGNTASVRVQRYSASPVQLTVTPSLGSAASIAFTTTQEVWVSNLTGNTVTGYAPGTNTVIDTITGTPSPYGIAFDASGNLWVPEFINNNVLAYAPGTTTPIAADTITAVNEPSSLVFDASGNLWIANDGNNSVTAFVPGTNSPIAADTITSSVNDPGGLAFDSTGNLWVSNIGTTSVTAYTPGTNVAIVSNTINAGLSFPFGLAFDANGHLLVANHTGNDVTVYLPGTNTPIGADTLNASMNAPANIAFDANGNLWVANLGSSSVTAYVPGTNTAIAADTITAGLSNPIGIAFSP